MSEENKHPHLQLIAGGKGRSLSSKQIETLASQEFNSGSFEKALERRDFFLSDTEIAGDKTMNPEEKIQRLKQAILEILEEQGSCLRAERLPPMEELETLANGITVNFSLIDFMSETERPDLPFENIEKHLRAFVDLIRKQCCVISLEELCSHLPKKGVDFCNTDILRIAFYEINRDRIVPLVLVLPNFHHVYKPFPVLMIGDFHVPPIVARVLRSFDK